MLTKKKTGDKLRCVLCGCKGIRQPVIKTEVVGTYLIPLTSGGAKNQRNMFSACKYHKRLYESWGTSDEKHIAFAVSKEHLKSVYMDWSIKDCYKEEANNDSK